MDNIPNELISSKSNLKSNKINSKEIKNIYSINQNKYTTTNVKSKPYTRKNNKFNNNDINFSILKKNKNYSARLIDVDKNYNLKKNYDNNSISYYRRTYDKNKIGNINRNINETNNMSNFSLLQKNTKFLTDINIIIRDKNEKETISKTKSIDNLNTQNINEHNKYRPKFITNFKNHKKDQKISNNKIKLNNFINKSSFKYFLLFRQSSKIVKKCFICDSHDIKLYHTSKCKHLFCQKCGKLYFEQQINNCIYNLKCPKYSCHMHLEINVLKQILSKYIYEKLIENMDTNSLTYDYNIANNSQNINSSRERIMKKNSLFSDNNSSLKENKFLIYNLTYQKEYIFKFEKNQNTTKKPKNDLLLKKLTNKFYRNSDKDLVNEHVIKIGGSSKFNRAVRRFNELKNIFCSQCNKSALFSVKNKPFIKCLNCGIALCKFCYKKYDYNHFTRNNAKACRVFFRAHITGKNVKYIYLYQLLYIFGGFFILYIGFSRIEAEFISNYNRNKIYWIYLVFFLILLFVNFFILIIFLPFYPLILLIVEV